MNKKRKSVAGRLFYTFGTIFLAAIIIVCALNFAKDGRAFQMPLFSATSANTVAEKEKTDTNTLKFNRSSTVSDAKSKSSVSEVEKVEKVEKTNVDEETKPDLSKNNLGNNP